MVMGRILCPRFRYLGITASLLLGSVLVSVGVSAQAAEPLPVVRVAALKYGTANWELELIRSQGLDAARGFRLEVIHRVSPNASLVALQGGAADFTVADWLWVARQATAGRNFRYYPYSSAVGELLVPAESAVQTLEDLRGATVGVAGGSEDKSWLLFQRYGLGQQMVLATDTTPKYAAPPLLSGLASTGQLDAVLTYWHYAARLKAEGFRSILSLKSVLTSLGVEGDVPMLGWVFSAAYGKNNPELVDSFLQASYAAKEMLRDDKAWAIVRPIMQADDDRVFEELRAGYRAGIPDSFDATHVRAIRHVAELVSPGVGEGSASLGDVDREVLSAVLWRGSASGAGF